MDNERRLYINAIRGGKPPVMGGGCCIDRSDLFKYSGNQHSIVGHWNVKRLERLDLDSLKRIYNLMNKGESDE